MNQFLRDVQAFANTAHTSAKSTRPAPSRNRYGVRALDVGFLDAGDRVEVALSFQPHTVFTGAILGADILYIPHPTKDTWVIIRDHDGAPGPLVTSVAYVPDTDEDDE